MKRSIILAVGLAVLSTTGGAQKFSTYTEPTTSAVYVQFSAEGFPPSCYEQRSKNPNFYTSLPLHVYSPEGIDNPIKNPDGTPVMVQRVAKTAYMGSTSESVAKVSHRFILSPTDVMKDGSTVVLVDNHKMDWATANGYLATANSVTYDVASSAVAMGCPMYRGKNGTDPLGSWRVPNHMEYAIISLFLNRVLLMDRTQTGFQDMVVSTIRTDGYWTANLRNSGNTEAMSVSSNNGVPIIMSITKKKTEGQHLRCIRDID